VEEQQEKERAEYGSYLVQNLAVNLEQEYGSGFSNAGLRPQPIPPDCRLKPPSPSRGGPGWGWGLNKHFLLFAIIFLFFYAGVEG